MNKPLCVLVDDDESCLSALRSHIEELNLLTIERAFLDPDKFLVQLDKLDSDIIFLDMDMPISGIEVAQKLKNKYVIFVSGHKEQAYQAFDINAVDFVPKPIRQYRLKQSIDKVLLIHEKKKANVLVVKTQDSKKEEINYTDIVYFESSEKDKRDKIIHLTKGNKILAKNIKFDDLSSKLSNDFLKVNKNNIVNLNHVTKLIQSDLIGVNHNNTIKELTLSDSHKELFFNFKPHFK